VYGNGTVSGFGDRYVLMVHGDSDLMIGMYAYDSTSAKKV
jgi:hypothetical protein